MQRWKHTYFVATASYFVVLQKKVVFALNSENVTTQWKLLSDLQQIASEDSQLLASIY